MQKKFFFLSVFFFVQLLSAQYVANWTSYQFIDPANDLTRDLAYNPATDHVLIATRYTGTNIFVLSGETGDSLDQMNTADIKEGTYPINQIEVADDGYIYVCNLAVAGNKFKIYRYQEEFLTPEVVYENVFEERYGDSFTAVGSGENLYLYSSGFNTDKILVLRGDADGNIEFDSKIDVPSINSARMAISPVTPGGNLWINGAGTTNPPARLITNDGTVIVNVPDSLLSPAQGSFIKYFTLGGKNYLAGANASLNTIRVFSYTEDQLGTVTFHSLGAASEPLLLAYNGTTISNNINASASIDYDSTRNSLVTLMGVNSVASVSLANITAIDNPENNVAQHFRLEENYPNPFNPETTIRYTLQDRANITLNVYDISGRLVSHLAQGLQNIGSHQVRFSATGLSSGVYFYSLIADGSLVQTRKMVVMK
ncbi:MAG: T9SS type A sorting domain-containing protein [Calditrichae bacterium]|nr:T9SS type A sorting domain-containing protein [Calditrichia bacterium]